MCVQNYCWSISESYESTFRTILLKRWRIVSHVQEILWKHFLFSINIYATLRKYLHEMWSDLIDITKWLNEIATTVGFQILDRTHEWIKNQKQFSYFLNIFLSTNIQIFKKYENCFWFLIHSWVLSSIWKPTVVAISFSHFVMSIRSLHISCKYFRSVA
jgi:hypothetical protein